eukprot:TRINITY_DN1326_c0_g1_i1.p1 TRINITY_DN1326_c0_g1~~TRINITY_DN1326_c0_g1_i1.p1  ORF type:complete len:389 (-),score=48.60 TRINITY_DN1326_c0_g1_i1:193-1359(-)
MDYCDGFDEHDAFDEADAFDEKCAFDKAAAFEECEAFMIQYLGRFLPKNPESRHRFIWKVLSAAAAAGGVFLMCAGTGPVGATVASALISTGINGLKLSCKPNVTWRDALREVAAPACLALLTFGAGAAVGAASTHLCLQAGGYTLAQIETLSATLGATVGAGIRAGTYFVRSPDGSLFGAVVEGISGGIEGASGALWAGRVVIMSTSKAGKDWAKMWSSAEGDGAKSGLDVRTTASGNGRLIAADNTCNGFDSIDAWGNNPGSNLMVYCGAHGYEGSGKIASVDMAIWQAEFGTIGQRVTKMGGTWEKVSEWMYKGTLRMHGGKIGTVWMANAKHHASDAATIMDFVGKNKVDTVALSWCFSAKSDTFKTLCKQDFAAACVFSGAAA